MGDNLWENMKKLSARVGMHTHPVFEYTEQYLKMATKDVGITLYSQNLRIKTIMMTKLESLMVAHLIRAFLQLLEDQVPNL